MRTTLECQSLRIDFLTRVQFCQLKFATGNRRDIRIDIGRTVVLRNRRNIIQTVIPGNIDSRHFFSFRESEQDTGRHREEERVMIFQIQRVYFRRQTEIQEFVCGIDDVSPPVAQCAHTEIVPATPLSQMVVMIIFVERTNTQPSVPIQCFGNWFTHRHVRDVRVPVMPTARRVHVSCYSSDVFDQTGFFPCLELEVVGFGMSLVTHLGNDTEFLFGTHHHFDFLEGAGHRFFHIYMFSMSHCLDRDREMRVIRYTDCNSIDLVGHLVEHLAEILETRNFREHGNKFLSMRCTHIYITKCNHFAQTGFIQFLCDLASTVTDTDKSDSHFFVGTDKRNTRHGIGLRRNPKRRNCCRS